MTIAKVCGEGIIAAVTGGYYHDVTQTDFINICHLYLWIILFTMPLLVAMSSHTMWIAIYTISVVLLFSLLKALSLRLHSLYDKSEPVKVERDDSQQQNNPEHPNMWNPSNENIAESLLPEISENHGSREGSLNEILQLSGPSSSAMPPGNSVSGLRRRPDSPIPEAGSNSSDSPTRHLMSSEIPKPKPMGMHESKTNIEFPVVAGQNEEAMPVTHSACGVTRNSSTISTSRAQSNGSNHNSKAEMRQQLEALRHDVNRLRLPPMPNEFVPSSADLELLDPNPAHRNFVTSISRSRNSSHHRRSFRTTRGNQALTATLQVTTTTTTIRRHSSANSAVMPPHLQARLNFLRQQQQQRTEQGDNRPMRSQSLKQSHSACGTTASSSAVTRTSSLRRGGGNGSVGFGPKPIRSRPHSFRKVEEVSGRSYSSQQVHQLPVHTEGRPTVTTSSKDTAAALSNASNQSSRKDMSSGNDATASSSQAQKLSVSTVEETNCEDSVGDNENSVADRRRRRRRAIKRHSKQEPTSTTRLQLEDSSAGGSITPVPHLLLRPPLPARSARHTSSATATTRLPSAVTRRLDGAIPPGYDHMLFDEDSSNAHWFRDPNGEWMVYTFGSDNNQAMTVEDWINHHRSHIAGSSSGGAAAVAASSKANPNDGATTSDTDNDKSNKNQYSHKRFGIVDLHNDEFTHLSSSYEDLSGRVWKHSDPTTSSGGGNIVRAGTPALEHLCDGGPSGVQDQSSRFNFELNDDPWCDWRPYAPENETRDRKRVVKKTPLYQLPLIPFSKKLFNLRFDRLDLEALFDRNRAYTSVILCILLAGLVALLGSIVISQMHYANVELIWFLAVIASAQFCLLKSVQPDTASPQQGYNSIIVYSRAVYFSTFALALICSQQVLLYLEQRRESALPFVIYGITVNPLWLITVLRNLFYYLLLYLPVLFLLGLLPQVDTFITYFIEQIDLHVFGASGASSAWEALFSLLRNSIALLIGYGFCYHGLILMQTSTTQPHVLFSVFWGIHLAYVYLLSRLPSNLLSFINASFAYRAQLANKSPNQNADDGGLDDTHRSPLHSEEGICKKHSIQCSHGDIFPASSSTYPHHLPSSPPPPAPPLVESSNLCSGDNPLPPNPVQNDPPSSCSRSSLAPRQLYLCDPQPQFMYKSLCVRLRCDICILVIWFITGFSLHVSTAFTSPVLQPILHRTLMGSVTVLGFLLHYVYPHLHKPYPWQVLNKPIINPSLTGKVTGWEMLHAILLWIEKNVFIPTLVLSGVSMAVPKMLPKYSPGLTAVLISLCSAKMLRHGFCHTGQFYKNLLVTYLLFYFDFAGSNEDLPMNYFVGSILVAKICELENKLHFVFVYLSPWKINWGSMFHAFAQVAYVPHSSFLLLQCFFSTLLSAPLSPFLASAIFISSYVRPIKFWEANYTTRHADSTNMALASQVRQEPAGESMNAIFYEHLTRSLQKSLAGDILLGRWGTVTHGDVFILAYEDLHFLVHIIEVGNGLVTFQLRGLELIGTFCHEHETEELRQNPATDIGFCCCHANRWFPHMLSLNSMLTMRWCAWQLIYPAYFLDAYCITDHNAVTSLQNFDFGKLIISYYVQCIIYFTCHAADLKQLLQTFESVLPSFGDSNFVEFDRLFTASLNKDFDKHRHGISRSKFLRIHNEWISFCLARRKDHCLFEGEDLTAVKNLCFALSLLGRRCIFTGDRLMRRFFLDSFLRGFHNIFTGNIQVNGPDEWVLADISLLTRVIQSAIHIAVKLFQDQFVCANFNDLQELHSAIYTTEREWVICHETDPLWRRAILNNAPNLCSFRLKDSTNHFVQGSYRIIMFTHSRLSFRVFKINSECVRGLWAGQQQEQIFLRNSNAERGSIQHAQQVLRNLINSSCDQPIGYPVYVSPLTTSFCEDSLAYQEAARSSCTSLLLLGCSVDVLGRLWTRLRSWFTMVRQHCRSMRHRSGTSLDGVEMATFVTSTNAPARHGGVAGGGAGGLTCPPTGSGISVCGAEGSILSTATTAAGKKKLYKVEIHNRNDTAELGSPPSTSVDPTTYSVRFKKSSSRDISSANATKKGAAAAAASSSTGLLTTVPGDAITTDTPSATDTVEELPPFIIESPREVLLDKHSKLAWPNRLWRNEAAHSLTLLPTTATGSFAVNILTGVVGREVYRWSPSHPELARRSFCHRVILLLRVEPNQIKLDDDSFCEETYWLVYDNGLVGAE